MNRVFIVILAAVVCTVLIGLMTFNGCGKTAKTSSSDELVDYLQKELKARQTELDGFREKSASSDTALELKAQIEKSNAKINAATEVLDKRQTQLDVRDGELSKKEGRLEERERVLSRRESQLDERESKVKEDEERQRKREEEFREKAEKDDGEVAKKSSSWKISKAEKKRHKEHLKNVLNSLKEQEYQLEVEKFAGLGDRMRINNALAELKRRIAKITSMIDEE